ncbi:MAG: NAD(P)H-dependent oxidoreductase [Saprospiraceae bacterium]|nr:NAD(P)H-dependent oxidoreductase [Saprospiraceae bacterium]MBK7736958.1 NAD(P)H-dependent oxidoreductase [Saprospiraceae bacterium]MBK7914448.1 NAD(P)H-dependent oxidoreductase [Saprospiraceae bacterium]
MSILVISGTNRKGSATLEISKKLCGIMTKMHVEHRFVNLEDFTELLSKQAPYKSLENDSELVNFQDSILIPSEKFIFVIPEYNGSFPGFLKWWIDTFSIRKAAESYKFKKAAFIGVSDGINGNVRGIDHFMAVCRYLKMVIYPGFVYFPSIVKVLDLWDENPKNANRLEKFIEEFSAF